MKIGFYGIPSLLESIHFLGLLKYLYTLWLNLNSNPALGPTHNHTEEVSATFKNMSF